MSSKRPSLRLPDKIINTTGWHDAWLARMVSYCFAEVELDPDTQGVRLARFSLAHNCDFRGWAYLGLRSFRVKINPLIVYPFAIKKRGFADLEIRNAIELVVMITSHELAHLRWPDATEAQTERRGRDVMLDFRRNRFAIAESWGYPGPGPVPPKVIHRLRCPRCGVSNDHSCRPTRATRRVCGKCFKSFHDGAQAGMFMIYERVSSPSEP